MSLCALNKQRRSGDCGKKEALNKSVKEVCILFDKHFKPSAHWKVILIGLEVISNISTSYSHLHAYCFQRFKVVYMFKR